MGSARAQKEDETRRRKVLNEIAFKRLGMERAQEVAELKARILVSTRSLVGSSRKQSFEMPWKEPGSNAKRMPLRSGSVSEEPVPTRRRKPCRSGEGGKRDDDRCSVGWDWAGYR